jgi:hypothetical protein
MPWTNLRYPAGSMNGFTPEDLSVLGQGNGRDRIPQNRDKTQLMCEHT